MKLNLINKEYSDIDYKVFTFPDGEVQIEILSEINHKEEIDVVCRITNAEDLFILMQVNDILTRHEITWNLDIKYLMSMRMDRVMSFNRPFTLKIVKSIIESFSCRLISVLEPHSEAVIKNRILKKMFTLYAHNDYNVIYPDESSKNRNKVDLGISNSYFIKSRDLETGKIISFEPCLDPSIDPEKPFLFIDDLCDGGGTFIGELEVLKKLYPNSKFEIIVCHAVNIVGIKRLCENFDKVAISNSYKDWSKYLASNKLMIIDVCK